jgi:predicted nucleotidyltransferase
VRVQKIMSDFDLAELYEVEARILNQAIQQNIDNFPEGFYVPVNERRIARDVITNCDDSTSKRPKSAIPYAFTEHGVTTLLSVLKARKQYENESCPTIAVNNFNGWAA